MNVSAGGAEDRTWREPRDDVIQVGSKVRSLDSSHEVCCWSSAVVLDPTLGRTVHVVSPVISVLCHSDRHVLMSSIQAVRESVCPLHALLFCTDTVFRGSVLFCSLAVLDPTVGHTVYVVSPFISVLCHSVMRAPGSEKEESGGKRE